MFGFMRDAAGFRAVVLERGLFRRGHCHLFAAQMQMIWFVVG
jgi:hypothetical protein